MRYECANKKKHYFKLHGPFKNCFKQYSCPLTFLFIRFRGPIRFKIKENLIQPLLLKIVMPSFQVHCFLQICTRRFIPLWANFEKLKNIIPSLRVILTENIPYRLSDLFSFSFKGNFEQTKNPCLFICF